MFHSLDQRFELARLERELRFKDGHFAREYRIARRAERAAPSAIPAPVHRQSAPSSRPEDVPA